MPTMKELRLEAGLSIAKLAELANVDRKTVERAEDGKPVFDTKAYIILSKLSERLGRKIQLNEVEGLRIR